MSDDISTVQSLKSKWESAKEMQIPVITDQNVKKALFDALDDKYAQSDSVNRKNQNGWFYAIAASFLIALLSWQFLSHQELKQPDKLLLTAINESLHLESQFEQLKSQSLNELVYIQKFRLETELLSINNRLADAYSNQENVQSKLQLWHQRNKTLSDLNSLMANAKSVNATHI